MSKRWFYVSVTAAVIARGMSAAQSNYKCMETPWPACMTQCGCPTSITQDFCSGNLPYTGTNTVSRFYCINWSGSSCTPNSLPCGGFVYLCKNCDCQNCSVICDGQCTLTEKPDFCTQSFGCQ